MVPQVFAEPATRKNRRCAAFLWYFMLEKFFAQRYFFAAKSACSFFSSAGPHLSRTFFCLPTQSTGPFVLSPVARANVRGWYDISAPLWCVRVRASVIASASLYVRSGERSGLRRLRRHPFIFAAPAAPPFFFRGACGANTWHSKHLSSCSKK